MRAVENHNTEGSMMASCFPSPLFASLLLLLFLFTNARSSVLEIQPRNHRYRPSASEPLPQSDIDVLEFPLNLEYLEAEFFLWGALGYGLDKVAPNLTMDGPQPVGAKQANLCPFVRDIITQFAYQEVGHLRAIKKTVEGFPSPRPLLDLTAKNFGNIIENAIDRRLEPQFDPYANSLNFLIASYIIPYVGLTGYVGANPQLQSPQSKRLVAGLLGVESAQDAVIRALLYQRAKAIVEPYNFTVAEITGKISELRNKLGNSGVKDEGIVVPPAEGAEGKTPGNVIAGDENSLAFSRTPEEILRIVYGEGNAHVAGGFFPLGADGNIAKKFLNGSK